MGSKKFRIIWALSKYCPWFHLNSRVEINNDSPMIVKWRNKTWIDHLDFHLCLKYWEVLELILKKQRRRSVLHIREFIVKWDFYHSMLSFSLYFRFLKTVYISCIIWKKFLKLKWMESVNQLWVDSITIIAVLSFDHKYFKKINFDKVIDEFKD